VQLHAPRHVWGAWWYGVGGGGRRSRMLLQAPQHARVGKAQLARAGGPSLPLRPSPHYMRPRGARTAPHLPVQKGLSRSSTSLVSR